MATPIMPATTPDKLFPDDFFPMISLSVGQLVIGWSFVEMSLKQWIAIIYHGAGGKHIEHEIPRGLKSEIKFLRRCFRNISSLEPFANEATSVLDRAAKLADIRHAVVHGYPSKYDSDTQTVTFVKLDARKHIHRIMGRPITFSQLLDAGRVCLDLGHDGAVLSKRLADAFVSENDRNYCLGGI